MYNILASRNYFTGKPIENEREKDNPAINHKE